jgi:hypothetical protein
MLRIESPPSSKKLSWTPTSSTWRTSFQIAASVASAAVRGGTAEGATASTGADLASLVRSIFPLDVRGKASTTATAAGTM